MASQIPDNTIIPSSQETDQILSDSEELEIIEDFKTSNISKVQKTSEFEKSLSGSDNIMIISDSESEHEETKEERMNLSDCQSGDFNPPTPEQNRKISIHQNVPIKIRSLSKDSSSKSIEGIDIINLDSPPLVEIFSSLEKPEISPLISASSTTINEVQNNQDPNQKGQNDKEILSVLHGNDDNKNYLNQTDRKDWCDPKKRGCECVIKENELKPCTLIKRDQSNIGLKHHYQILEKLSEDERGINYKCLNLKFNRNSTVVDEKFQHLLLRRFKYDLEAHEKRVEAEITEKMKEFEKMSNNNNNLTSREDHPDDPEWYYRKPQYHRPFTELNSQDSPKRKSRSPKQRNQNGLIQKMIIKETTKSPIGKQYFSQIIEDFPTKYWYEKKDLQQRKIDQFQRNEYESNSEDLGGSNLSRENVKKFFKKVYLTEPKIFHYHLVTEFYDFGNLKSRFIEREKVPQLKELVQITLQMGEALRIYFLGVGTTVFRVLFDIVSKRKFKLIKDDHQLQPFVDSRYRSHQRGTFGSHNLIFYLLFFFAYVYFFSEYQSYNLNINERGPK